MISGQCCFCQKGLFSCCDRINPNAEIAAKAMGQSPAGLFGFTMLGGRSGGQNRRPRRTAQNPNSPRQYGRNSRWDLAHEELTSFDGLHRRKCRSEEAVKAGR